MVAPLIHIGYHKTGTTWLQKRIFRADSGFGFMRAELEDIELALISVNPYGTQAVKTSWFDELKAKAEPRSLIPVISHERLSGNPLANSVDAPLIANRLINTFGDARVLIVIREQREMMISLYKQVVFVNLIHASFRSFWKERLATHMEPQLGMHAFEYHHQIAHYQKTFGKDRVLVLTYELLRSDPLRFVREIARFAGAPEPTEVPLDREHESPPSSLLPPLRYVNLVVTALGLVRFFRGRTRDLPLVRAKVQFTRLLGRIVRKIGPRDVEARWKAVATELTKGRFAETNRITSELIGVDLGAYGYEVGPPLPSRKPTEVAT